MVGGQEVVFCGGRFGGVMAVGVFLFVSQAGLGGWFY